MADIQADAVESGRQALQAGDTQAALGWFSQALHENIGNATAWGLLGIAQVKLGELDNGIASLGEAQRLQPDNLAAQYNLAVALIQANRKDEARQWLEYSLSIDPANAKAQAALNSLAAQQPAVPPPTAPQPPAPGMDLTAPPVGLAAGMALPTTPVTSAPLSDAPPRVVSLGAAPAVSAGPSGLAPAGGMQFRPEVVKRQATRPPNSGERIGRGLMWGLVFGQYWTAWNLFWSLVWSTAGASHVNTQSSVAGAVLLGIVFAVIFGIGGCILGLIIGAANLNVQKGALAGVVFGLIFCALEFFVTHSGAMLINVFFWYFTGRYVGARTANKVQWPVATA